MGVDTKKKVHRPDACVLTDNAPGQDVMEQSDKTVEIKIPIQACVHLQGWDQHPQEAQETIINCSPELDRQNKRQDNMQESRRRHRLI